MFEFDNTYAKLPEKFFANVTPLVVPQATLRKFNESLAIELGKKEDYSLQQLAQIFSGQKILSGSQPIAMAYAGHQFGHFVPQLGDGRAILLGEVLATNGIRYDVQLKGAGRTPFSRGGDGRCPLGPAIREYIISEAMHALGVPTTRALAVVTTGDFVHRNRALPGAIFTRVAKSHIRVGTFEYFASREDQEAVKQLADYAIARHYPTAQEHDNPYIAFFKSVAQAQISLVSTWMSLGFIHGVMNTDNTTISGETIDYGPCAFMDEFNFHQVFSSIDHQGRYAYANQAAIILWNLSRLGDCLLPLVDQDPNKAISILEDELAAAHRSLEQSFVAKIATKLGIKNSEEDDNELITAWLQYLQTQKYDYTISFRELMKLVNSPHNDFFENTPQFRDFLSMWKHRIRNQDNAHTQKIMQEVNPVFIPRNHQVERAISHAMKDDFTIFEELNTVLQKPYVEQPQFAVYQQAPSEEQKVKATFCGTQHSNFTGTYCLKCCMIKRKFSIFKDIQKTSWQAPTFQGQKNMFELCCDWLPQGDQPKAIAKLTESIQNNKQYQTLLGVTGSGKTFVMANVIQKLQRPTIIISHNKTLAAQLYSEFKSFFPKNAVEYFVSYYDFYQPEAYIAQRDIYIEKESSINEQLDKLRLSSTSSLLSRPDTIIVASVSCIYGLGDPEDYRSMVVRIEKDTDIERDDLLRQLVNIQYERNDLETSRGTFRVRGDTIEIYPSDEAAALRVEMFGDTIEKIAYIEPVSKEVLKEVSVVSIYPAKHFVTPAEKVEKAIVGIREELKEQLQVLKEQQKLLEASRLETRTLHDLEMLREVGYCSGVENYSRHFSSRKAGERPFCLLDYAPKDFLTFIDESHVTIPQIRGMYRGDRARKENLVNHGFRLPSALDNRPLKLKEWEKVTKQTVFVSATPNEYELEQSQHEAVQLIIRPTGLLDPEVEVIPTENQVQDIIERIKQKAEINERVLVTTLTKSLSEDLTDFMKDAGIKVAYLHCDIDAFERVTILQDLRKGKYDVVIGINLLREGLDLPEVSLVAILDADREGFLRSETALIQTMGRAARNARAKVILYGDRITPAMKNAMEETQRRREIQQAYNEKHGIEPQDITKKILSGIEEIQEQQSELDGLVRESTSEYNAQEQIQELEKHMMLAAQELNFELAAKLRDQLISLKEGGGTKTNKRKKGRRRRRRG